ncbi:hypothetical protein F7731_25340 [Cytobacillus depressus]|uniref:Uncharacterized protein n=1 Tax=Cytobacillus depressus TaxID=1602942 RepID=A0A6L3UWW7_9BACI|nr:hypothetical protein [Cytobacillus depressus]KAB2328549.1 hypothetical protein F7731_25340 [Cytobacillus depressus]
MKKIWLLLVLLFLLVGCMNNNKTTSKQEIPNMEKSGTNEPQNELVKEEDYQVVASSNEEDVTIYAKEMDGLYYNFKIDYKDISFKEPFWMNVTNPSYAPQIIVEDIDGNGTEELIIILTLGYGTGTLKQEVHVYHIENNFSEVLVDNPMAIVFKNVKATLLPNEAKISIADKQVTVDFEVEPEYLNNEVGFGGIINYYVKDNQLIANIGTQVSPAGFIGNVVIKYEYRDKMYQAKSIEFQTIE